MLAFVLSLQWFCFTMALTRSRNM